MNAEPESFNDLYGRLDSSAELLDVLANALHAMGEREYFVDTPRDKLADVDNHLGRAFDELDSDDPDPVDVTDECTAARRSLETVNTMANHAGFASEELPDHVDSGVYDTFGELTKYVLSQLRAIEQSARDWRVER